MAPIRCCFDQTAVWHSDAARGPSTPSFNHLSGANEQSGWHSQAERVGGLQVDDQFDFGNLLDRQVGGLLALEDTVGVDASRMECIRNAASVAYQAASRGELAKMVGRGHRVTN